jgi:hypothetical protein
VDTPDRRRKHFNELVLQQQKQQQEAMAQQQIEMQSQVSQRRVSERDNHRRRESREVREINRDSREVNVPAPLSAAADIRASERPMSSPRRERVTERVVVADGQRRESGRASDRNREAMREAREREHAEEAEAQGSPAAANVNGADGTPTVGSGGFTAVNR